MKYFWTFVWAFLLAHMVTYVVGSIGGNPYDFVVGTILAVVFTVAVLLIPAILPKDEESTQS